MTRINTGIFNYNKLQQGKFRNKEFYIFKDGETRGGRKTVTHEYPNSDRRFVEDLGLNKKTYSFEAIIITNRNFNDRDAFIKALEQEGEGTLVHPFYGTKTVTLKGYSLINELGLSRFDLTFEEVTKNVLPAKETGTKSLIEKLKNDLFENQESIFGSIFNTINKRFKTIEKGVNKVQDALDIITQASNSIRNVTDSLGDLQNSIQEITDDIYTLVRQPATLASNLTSTFNNFALIPTRFEDLLSLTQNLYGFGDNDTDEAENTDIQRTIKENNRVANNLININALALGYLAAVNIEYANEEQLKEARDILEEQFKSLENLDKSSEDLLDELRVEANILFDQLLQTVPKIFTVNITSNQNLYQIVNDYYGDFLNTDNFETKLEEIKNLNNIQNPNNIQGEIKLLTS